jgi:hypothetical protein
MRGAMGEARGARFDEAIDRAVREMLDVEPPDGLRGRVLARIDSTNPVASAFRRKIWIAVPLAAAAILVLAVLLPSRTPSPAVEPVKTIAGTQPVTQPQPVTTAPSATAPTPPRTVIARTATPRPRTRPSVDAAVAATDAAADVVWIDPLAAPPPIAVAAIEPVQAGAIPSIDLAPAQIPALEVRPISDTPRERRNQE